MIQFLPRPIRYEQLLCIRYHRAATRKLLQLSEKHQRVPVGKYAVDGARENTNWIKFYNFDTGKLKIFKLKKNPSDSWLKYLGLTTQLLVLIALAVYAGLWLDKKWHVSPLFLILLPLAVLGGVFYNLYKETIKKKSDE